MNSPINNTISDVERETGLGKDTLRVWERRYHFPQPLRDAFDERVYPIEQVNKLRIIKRLIDGGYRPGKIIHLSMEELQKLSEDSHSVRSIADLSLAEHADLQHCLELCKTHQFEELRRTLYQSLLQMGLRRFVTDLIAPLNHVIGDSWATGYLAVFEEHLYTESVQVVLRSAIAQVHQNGMQSARQPRILLTTFPQERHGLGLLMAEALFSLEGAYCISLGLQTPVMEIMEAATSQNTDIIALSFSKSMNPKHALDGLSELRSRLPESIEVWAGGTCPVLSKRPPKNIHAMNLLDIEPCLEAWRKRH